MKKKLFGLLVLVMALVLCMVGAASADDCQHKFANQNCTSERFCSKCDQWFTTNTAHSWGSWSSGTGSNHVRRCTNDQCAAADGGTHTGGTATCTEQAVCGVCGQPYGEVDSDNHDWGEWESGGAHKEVGHGRKCKWNRYHHEEGEHTGGSPTCNVSATCDTCGGAYFDGNNHGGNATTDWGTYDNTKHVKLCEGCKFVVDRAEHVFDSDADATCDTCGYTREVAHEHEYVYVMCDNVSHQGICDCSATTELEPHTMGDWETAGEKWERHCTATGCDYLEESDTDPSSGGAPSVDPVPVPKPEPEPDPTPRPHSHSYSGSVTMPTCTSGGYTVYYCVCGDTFVGSRVDALGHAWGAWTSDDHGGHSRVCTRNAAHTEQGDCTDGPDADELCDGCGYDLHVHNYNSYAYDSGNHWLVCACGDNLEPEDHDWYIYKKDAKRHYWHCDCGNSGWADTHIDYNNTDKCDDCGHQMHAHSYTSVVTAPTCGEDGYTTYTCSCGASYKDDYVAKTRNHDWSKWAFFVGDGGYYHKRTCPNCGGKQQEGCFDKDYDGYCDVCDAGICNHKYAPANCIAPPTCSICGKPNGNAKDPSNHVGETAFKPSEHNPQNYHVECCTACGGVTASVKPGAHTFAFEHDANRHWEVCSVCGYATTKQPHDYTDDADTSCNVCGYVRPAHEHNWGWWRSNGDGTHTRTCNGNSSHFQTMDCTADEANCMEASICPDCGVTLEDVDPTNHTGGTIDQRNGLMIETYCLGCGEMINSEYISVSSDGTPRGPSKIENVIVVGVDHEETSTVYVGGEEEEATVAVDFRTVDEVPAADAEMINKYVEATYADIPVNLEYMDISVRKVAGGEPITDLSTPLELQIHVADAATEVIGVVGVHDGVLVEYASILDVNGQNILVPQGRAPSTVTWNYLRMRDELSKYLQDRGHADSSNSLEKATSLMEQYPMLRDMDYKAGQWVFYLNWLFDAMGDTSETIIWVNQFSTYALILAAE